MMFRLAISIKSKELLNILLGFYKETQLKGNPESMEYKKANDGLKRIFQDADESLEIIPEIKSIIKAYLIYEEDENEQDLSGFDIEEDYDGQDSSYTIHKSNSAPDLLAHQALTTNLLHSSRESIVSNGDSSDGEMHEGQVREVLGKDFGDPSTE